MAGGKTILIDAVCGIALAASLPSFAIDRAPETPRLRDLGAGSDARGNPLWAIPLQSLNVTRDRPILLPSRRPPAPVVAGAPPTPVPPGPPPAEPERFQLALVGAVAGDSDGIAVFVDQTTQGIVRLRSGESHAGWILRSVKGREVTVEKGRNSILLALPATAEQDGTMREIESPPNAAALAAIISPSPPPVGERAPPAISAPAPARSPGPPSSRDSAAPADGAAPAGEPAAAGEAAPSPLPPPIGDQAPPATAGPAPPGGSSPAPPPLGVQAPPAMAGPLLGIDVARPN
jgi:hypothetical protein